MTDLETELRDALAHRADAIRDHDLRGAGARRRRPLWPMLAAAALVVALAVGATALLTRDRSAPAAHDPDPVPGYTWALVSVTTRGTTVGAPVPVGAARETVAQVAVDRRGGMTADDTVNFAGGRYRRTADGFRVAGATTTDAGYAGRDQRVLAAQLAIAAVMGGADVAAQVNGDSLVLRVRGYTLRLHRSGAVNTPAPSVSSTPPATALTPAIGITWRLVSVTTRDGTFPAPDQPREQPRIAFYADGRFVADDSVNTYEGRYRPTSTGYAPDGSASVSAVGTVDTPVLRALRVVTGALTSGAAVTVEVTATTLVLRTQGVSATYRR